MGTRSSLEKFGTARPMDNNNAGSVGATLDPAINGVEKARSMTSINEQSQNGDVQYRNNSLSSTDSSSGTPLQIPRQQRPRSAPDNQSVDSTTQESHTVRNTNQPILPERRRLAVCEANDAAENARRKMRVYQKRF